MVELGPMIATIVIVIVAVSRPSTKIGATMQSNARWRLSCTPSPLNTSLNP